MFANTKWKGKLLAAHAGMALYFDSTHISASNRCAQVQFLFSFFLFFSNFTFQKNPISSPFVLKLCTLAF